MHKSPSAHRAGSRTPRPAASKGARGASQHTLDVLFPSTLPVLTGPGSNAQTERSPEGLSPGRPRLRGRAHTCACVRADMCVRAWTCTPRDRGHTRVPRRVRACVRVSVCACPRLSVRRPRGRVPCFPSRHDRAAGAAAPGVAAGSARSVGDAPGPPGGWAHVRMDMWRPAPRAPGHGLCIAPATQGGRELRRPRARDAPRTRWTEAPRGCRLW